MNRKVIKVVSILLMVLMMAIMVAPSVFATTAGSGTGVTDFTDPENFGKADKFNSGDGNTTTVFGNFIATIINIVQVVGMGVAIIMLVVLAIKYISAAPSEKAELKKTATIYVVGAIVLFAATGILQIIKNFAVSNVKAASTTSVVETIDRNDMYVG